MRITRAVLLSALAPALACGASDRQSPSSEADGADGGDQGGGGGGGGGAGDGADGAPPASVTYVFAHSDQELYRVDPDTLEIQLVGRFDWSNGHDEMTDIAIDRDGRMIGISYDRVYAVNSDTASTSYLADLDRDFNGLSFLPDPSQPEVEILIGAAQDGSVYEIDPMTGASTSRGNYGDGMGSSGDIVSVAGFGTAATVTMGFGGSDQLARVENDSSADLIGDTGVEDLWGLGFWGDKVYGFAEDGSFVLLDVNTGEAQLIERAGVAWWGAGVTTAADVIVD
ncbi:MAG TPA: hypothetical protein VIG06_05635 [Kofleriaceae bacterium]|jgi:hypothetical protein